jgi:curved DNA-binding protein CbpA
MPELFRSKALKILELSEAATYNDVKKNYRKLALKLHPDKTGGDDGPFKELSEAKQRLGETEEEFNNIKQVDAEKSSRNAPTQSAPAYSRVDPRGDNLMYQGQQLLARLKQCSYKRDYLMKDYSNMLVDYYSALARGPIEEKRDFIDGLAAEVSNLERVQLKQQAIAALTTQFRSSDLGQLNEIGLALDKKIRATEIPDRAQCIESIQIAPEYQLIAQLNACRYKSENDPKMTEYIEQQLHDLNNPSADRANMLTALKKTVAGLEAVQPQQAFITTRSERLKDSKMSRMGLSTKHEAIDREMKKLSIPDRIEALSDLDSEKAAGLKDALNQKVNPFKTTEATSSKDFKERFQKTTEGRDSPTSTASSSSAADSSEEEQDNGVGPPESGL